MADGNENTTANAGHKAWTSDLSTRDLWILEDRGYEPLGLVVGNCVFAMGFGSGFSASLKAMARGEVQEYTKLLYEARELAIGRMQEEASTLQADGVIAVRIEIENMHGGQWLHIMAMGTAVRRKEGSDGQPSGKAMLML